VTGGGDVGDLDAAERPAGVLLPRSPGRDERLLAGFVAADGQQELELAALADFDDRSLRSSAKPGYMTAIS
jgi:hypothetical protein